MAEKYRVIDYFDVWGNEEDGYEVNNLCEVGVLELPDSSSDESIISGLIDFGFLKPTVTKEDVAIWNDYYMIELHEAARMKPLCRLELIAE